jgi:excisionase family DNA binding protein
METNDKNFEDTRLIDLTVGQFKELLNHRTNVVQVQEKENPEDFLTAEEARVKLKVALSTLYGMVCRKEISVHKPGKKLYFKREDLNNFISHARKKSKIEFLEEVNQHSRNNVNRKISKK